MLFVLEVLGKTEELVNEDEDWEVYVFEELESLAGVLKVTLFLVALALVIIDFFVAGGSRDRELLDPLLSESELDCEELLIF